MKNITNDKINLTQMEEDIIGEVMNISMGSAATAMSTILDKKVSITAPRLKMSKSEEFEFSHLEPVLGVVIKYIEGVGGLNMLLLKEEDFKKILSHLLGIGIEEITEFDEISKSAICEIMNQMMGSAASALATFLGVKVNISPPEIMEVSDKDEVRKKLTLAGPDVVSIAFDINIEDLVKSEFVSLMEPKLAKEIISMSLGENPIEDDKNFGNSMVTGEDELSNLEPSVSKAVKEADSQIIQAVPFTYPQLDKEKANGADLKEKNLDLVMSVPLQITVELGKTRRKIKDIVEFSPGNIIELDRQAGDQVDIMANGRLIARGDVVVVDDNYSVRITEIMKARDSLANAK